MTSVFRRMPPALLLLLLTVSNMFAQEAPPLPESVVNLPVATDGLRQPTKFKPAVTIDEVRPHIEFLASEELRGRRGRDAMRAADYLVAEFRKCKLQPLFGDSFAQVIPGPKRADGAETFYGRNVGAWLPGSDPELRDEFVIISAHYDHLGVRDGTVYRGADDNASGTSMMLTLARRFSELTTRPRRSVVFIGFDLEEHLLWGSRWFVAHPPWPIERVKFFMTADMIGRSLGNLPLSTVFVLGSEHGTGLDDVLDEIGEPAGLNVARMGIDLIGTRSDYGPFRDRDIPFLFFSTGEHPDYHKPTDTPERIDYEQVARVSSLVEKVVHKVADNNEAPVWNPTVTPRMQEVQSLHRIAELLLKTDENLTSIQRFIVKQAEVQTRQIMQRGVVQPNERGTLIRTAQLLLLSVF